MTVTYRYNDGRLSGGRYPRLWFVKGGVIHHFEGKDIPGVCVITARQYTKNGKWSATDYSIAHGPSTVPVELCSPLHGKTWNQSTLAKGLEWLRIKTGQDVTEEEFRRAIGKDYPTTLARWDEVSQLLMDIE